MKLVLLNNLFIYHTFFLRGFVGFGLWGVGGREAVSSGAPASPSSERAPQQTPGTSTSFYKQTVIIYKLLNNC